MMKGSIRTTLAGVGVILVAVGHALTAMFDSDPATTVNVGLLVAEIIAGVGLISARDDKVSSETAGAK